MHPSRIAVLTDSFRRSRTRRGLAQLLGRTVLGTSSGRLPRDLVAAIGLAPALLPEAGFAKKKRRKKLKRNAFGCVNVGEACRGKDAVCCSGICRGKRPRQGEWDKSRCVAHDVGSCAPGKDACGPDFVPCTTSGGLDGQCYRTTGNAPFCSWSGGGGGDFCRRDADCIELLGPGAACVHCGDCTHDRCCGTPYD